MTDFKTIKPGDFARDRAKNIREFILARLDDEQFIDVIDLASEHFGVERHVIRKQLRRLEESKEVEGRGRTKARVYRLVSRDQVEWFQREGLAEFELWKSFAEPKLEGLPESVLGICSYGFTEMVNNAIDHSGSERVLVGVERSRKRVELTVMDEGIGIFRKLQQDLGLPSAQDAIFELSKGKLTTDPTKHTGEGIFYTSRMFDSFRLLSSGLFLLHQRAGNDWLTGTDGAGRIGTTVFMAIETNSEHTVQEVFDFYSVPREDFAFNKTNVILRLLDGGDDRFISRSQAKRVLARLPRFKEVILDFVGVDSIGPAFADEIFRVFAIAHPDVHLVPVNTSEQVNKMIERAKGANQNQL
jgi:anti-sigma regulatory factor (Ser/Thr protein kinase)